MIDPLAAMRANMRGFSRLLGERSPGGQVFEHERLLASLVPEADETARTHLQRSGHQLDARPRAMTLAEARERGCETSSRQATNAGFPVYVRCGYRDRRAFEMWEHRGA
jgi:hypothetical protein